MTYRLLGFLHQNVEPQGAPRSLGGLEVTQGDFLANEKAVLSQINIWLMSLMRKQSKIAGTCLTNLITRILECIILLSLWTEQRSSRSANDRQMCLGHFSHPLGEASLP